MSEVRSTDQLAEFDILALPEEIEHQIYIDVLAFLQTRPDKTVKLFCRGDGGNTRAALAIVDLLQHHGRVVGLLTGEANSSHAVIWAGCSKRYVYPRAAIGVHKIAMWSLNSRVDSLYAQQIANEYEQTESSIAALFASISSRSATDWKQLIDTAGSGGVKQIFADELIKLGMAQPISEFR